MFVQGHQLCVGGREKQWWPKYSPHILRIHSFDIPFRKS